MYEGMFASYVSEMNVCDLMATLLGKMYSICVIYNVSFQAAMLSLSLTHTHTHINTQELEHSYNLIYKYCIHVFLYQHFFLKC